MGRVRALLLAAVFILVISTAVTPAFAWYWPILGFSDICHGYPQQGFKPVPGTLAWQNYPGSWRAQQVVPGVAYCPFIGHLGFGFAPGGFGPPDNSTIPASESAAQNNETD